MLKLNRFIIYDGIPPEGEGESIEVIWNYPHDENENEQKNVAGICYALLEFSKTFNHIDICDYIKTKRHEICVLVLHNEIYMAIFIESTNGYSRKVLRSLLETFRTTFTLFWDYPKRDENGKVSRQTCNFIRSAFSLMFDSIKWEKVVFFNLWNSNYQKILNSEESIEVTSFIQRTLESNSKIQHVALIKDQKIIISSFPQEITRSLQFCMIHKYKYLYPHQLSSKDDDQSLVWVVGISKTHEGQLQVFTPIMHINNMEYTLLILRIGSIRIILSTNTHTLNSNKDIQSFSKSIKKFIKPVMRILEPIKVPDVEIPHIKISTIPHQDVPILEYQQKNIRPSMRQSAEINIIRAQSWALSFDTTSKIAFPGVGSFFTVSMHSRRHDYVNLYHSEEKIIKSLRKCQDCFNF